MLFLFLHIYYCYYHHLYCCMWKIIILYIKSVFCIQKAAFCTYFMFSSWFPYFYRKICIFNIQNIFLHQNCIPCTKAALFSLHLHQNAPGTCENSHFWARASSHGPMMYHTSFFYFSYHLVMIFNNSCNCISMHIYIIIIMLIRCPSGWMDGIAHSCANLYFAGVF